MALTADQLNTIYQNVLFRNVDQAGIQFFANRTDISDANVRQQIELSNEASTFVSPIVRLYQEVLGRVPDVQGLRFFSTQLRGGTTLDTIAQSLISSQEFSTKTAGAGIVDSGDFSNTNQLVTDAFQSILGRSPAASEFAFFQGRTPAQILAGVAGSPEAAGTNAAAVVTFLDSAAVGSPNTGSLNSQSGTGAGGTGSGSQFVLTTNVDAPGASAPSINTAGTAGNDTYVGSTGTLTSADIINGGSGTDTLTFRDTTANTAAITPALTSVENVQVTALDGTLAPTIFNLASSTGVTTLASVNSSAGVQFQNAAALAALQVTGTTGGAPVTLGYANSVVAGTSDVQAVAFSSAIAGDINIGAQGTSAGIETLNVTSTGTNTITSLVTGAATVSFAGAGSLAIANATTGALATLTNATSIDASQSSGGVSFAIDGTKDVTVKGSTGNDIIGVAGLTTADSIDAGNGTDFASFADTTTLPTAKVSNLLNFEGVRVEAAGGATATINVDNFSGSTINQFQLGTGFTNQDGLAGGTINITNGTSGSTITQFDSANVDGNVTFALKTDGSADTLTYNLTNTDATGAVTTHGLASLTANGIETLNINANNQVKVGTTFDNDVLSIASITDTAATTLKITGNSALSLGTTASSLTSLTSIDASGATKAITLGAVGTAFSTSVTGATVVTGSGDDFVSLNVGNTGVLKSVDLGTQTSAGTGDTLALTGGGALNGVTVVDLSSTTDQVTQLLGSTNSAAQINIENITLTGLTGPAQITGSSGANIIVGTGFADTINGGAGNDTITGGVGVDIVAGGTGTDRFNFSTGHATAGTNFAGGATPAAGNTVVTDAITDFASGETVNLTLGAGTLAAAAGGTVGANTFVLVAGNYDSATNTFTVAAGGTSTAVTYDGDTTTGGLQQETIVLVGTTTAQLTYANNVFTHT